MAINLKGRSFLTLEDFTPAEIRYLLDLGHNLKAKRRAGICDPTLQGKHIVLLFEKTSTRTRCSFEVAATQEGGHVTYLDAGSSQMGKKESLEDTAKVLGRFFDGIEYRGYDQKVVEDLAKYAGVPVWNGLTDADHPTQILADMMTIEEHCHKPLNQVKVVFPGDVRNNMCYAWMIGAAKMGMHFVGLGPQELAKEMEAGIRHRTGERRPHRDHRRHELPEGCGRDLRRHLGFHGRGGPDPRAGQAADALPGDGGDTEGHRQLQRAVSALPALLP